MKDIHRILEEELKTMILVCEDIYKHPELGFKEFRTRQKVIDVLDKAGIAHQQIQV